MSKKSIFSLTAALILTFTLQSGVFSEKSDNGQASEQKTTQSSADSKTTDKKNTDSTDKDTDTSNKATDKKDADTKKTDSASDSTDEFPELHTDYYMLADLDSGDILSSKNINEKVYPASTTKILTGIIALENLDLAKVVTATNEAIDPIDNNHSNMGIRVGEELTVEQLLYGMLVHSANDAANVLAVEISGGLDKFADLMNERARELGAENSHFTNAHGFHDDNHYTTISDLAKFACYAMQNEKFREIVSTSRYQIPPTNKYTQIRYLANTNMLISNNRASMHLYKYAIGIKTGHTDESGSCLVAAADKNGTKLLSIVMKCQNDGYAEKAYSFVDTKALFEYGYNHFTRIVVASKEDIVSNLKVREAKGGTKVSLSPADDIAVLLPKDTDKSLIKCDTETDEAKAPIDKGDILGKATYSLDGKVLGTVNLIAANDVKRDFLLHIIYSITDILSNPIVIIALIVLILFLLYARSIRIKNRRRQRRRLREMEERDEWK